MNVSRRVIHLHPPPVLLYTNRDYCKEGGPSKYQRLFYKWSALIVRLNSLHYIRRLAIACVNESNPLYRVIYGPFVKRLIRGGYRGL